MGWFSNALHHVASVATGGLSDVVDAVTHKSNPLDAIKSVATGGLSKVAEGAGIDSDAINSVLTGGVSDIVRGEVPGESLSTYMADKLGIDPKVANMIASGGLSSTVDSIKSGDPLRIVTSLATSGIGDIADTASGGKTSEELERFIKDTKLGRMMTSAGTLGLSDVAQGNMPGQAISDEGRWAQVLNPVTFGLNASTGGLSDLAYGYQKAQHTDGDTWDKIAAGADRAVDINGTVDVGLRAIGDEINRAAPEVVPYIKPVATTIGAIAGSYIPVLGNAAGAAIGSGAGSKLGQGNRNYDYKNDFIDAGAAYGSYAVGGEGILGGAAGGAIASAPTAIRENSWKPIVRGATTGAILSAVNAGVRELSDLYKYGESLGKAGSTAYDGGSMSYDGGVNYVPVGAGSFADSVENPTTLNQLMTELETPSGGGMSLPTDPIPTESNPIGTPEFSATQLPDTDTSSMNFTESFQYAEPAYKTAKTAYNLYNIGKGVYDNYQNYQDIKDQQPVSQTISQPVQTPITAPVGVSYTLGNMPIGEDERRAWGRVLV